MEKSSRDQHVQCSHWDLEPGNDELSRRLAQEQDLNVRYKAEKQAIEHGAPPSGHEQLVTQLQEDLLRLKVQNAILMKQLASAQRNIERLNAQKLGYEGEDNTAALEAALAQARAHNYDLAQVLRWPANITQATQSSMAKAQLLLRCLIESHETEKQELVQEYEERLHHQRIHRDMEMEDMEEQVAALMKELAALRDKHNRSDDD